MRVLATTTGCTATRRRSDFRAIRQAANNGSYDVVDVVGGRVQRGLRVIKRQRKQFPDMTRPRSELNAELRALHKLTS